MNIVVALLSLLRLGHFALLRPRLVPRAPASSRVVGSMQIERDVVNCLYFRDAPPSITRLQPIKNASHVGKCGGVRCCLSARSAERRFRLKTARKLSNRAQICTAGRTGRALSGAAEWSSVASRRS